MPDFQPYTWDFLACQQQVQELKQFLDSTPNLAEKALRKFFKPRRHLQAMVGFYNPSVASPDCVAWEYPLFGDFRCDFAVGDWGLKDFTFVECDRANANCLFVKQGAKITRAWSPHFEAGHSQIIDWFYKLHVMTDTPDMEARLGQRNIRYTGVLLIGRDQHLKGGELDRLEWGRQHVVVNSRHIVCLTYDQLLEDLLFRLNKFNAAGNLGG